jgi:CO dehydrogenase/acetyl-CoA synthase beta subunit
MNVFDDCIKEIREWFGQKENAGEARRYESKIPAKTSQAISGSSSGSERGSAIIFKEDTHLELGHPSLGSCSATLATHDSSLVENGRITLVGPDVGETDKKMLPFAQIAIACCEGNIEDTCSTMDRVLHTSAQSDGYMLRSVPDMIWARVSKDAACRGFSMSRLGAGLIDSLNEECAGILKSEMFFVTSSREDVSELKERVDPARDKLRKLQAFARKEDGTYECDTGLDCVECPEKPVCDTIRDVIIIRKGDRIITLGGDGGDNGKKSF